MVTIFKNINETGKPYYISVKKALDRIRGGQSKELLDKVRSTEAKDVRNELKKGLPSVCFGGKFSSRSDNALIEASGLMSIDFDGFESTSLLEAKRFELEMDDYTYACFESPSGNGLKVLVKIPSTDSKGYKSYFKAIEKYYNCPNFDSVCSNISRVTYESYDPNIYVNEKSAIWNEKFIEDKPVQRKVVIPVDDTNKTIEYLHKWWEKNHGLVSGKRNQNLFILAAAYNQYGISIDEAKQSLLRFEQSDFTKAEIVNTINSAYKNTSEFNTKKFEDTEAVDKLTDMVARSVPKEDIKKVLNVNDDDIEAIALDFWTKSKKDFKVNFINHRYREFLVSNGYCKFYPSEESNFWLTHVKDNIITTVFDDNIRDFVFEYLYNMDDKSVYDAYAEKIKLGKEDFLSFLPNIKPRFLKDSRDHSYLYFRNCAVKVTADKVETINYDDLDGFVWSKQRIDRDYILSDYEGCEYKRFLTNISGKDDSRLNTMQSTIGYLMHMYNDSAYNPVVILNDETISDKPEGGTGKGIYVNAISKMRRAVFIDGKKFDSKDKFQYQRVTADTQLLAYQDVEKNFNFEVLFSMITDGITVEVKHGKQLYFPFEDIPKMVITTNHAIKGDGNSHARRKWELEFTQYYKDGFTPLQEFGHNLFDGWDSEEWLKFDNYMIANLQLYLSKGLMKSKFKNLEIRKLEAATSHEFREYILGKDKKWDFAANVEYLAQDILNDFCTNYPDYGPTGKIKLTHRTFYRWMNEYAKYKFGTSMSEHRGANGKIIKFFKIEAQQELCI